MYPVLPTGRFAAIALAVMGFCLCGCGRHTPPAPDATPPEPLPNSPAEAAEATYPLTVTDDEGIRITFDSAPNRIISMSPPLTEMLFALGLGDRVVGVTRFCNYPEEATAKAQIGGIADPSEEQIVALNPDVVFVTVGNPMPVIESLRQDGVRVYSANPGTYLEVAECIERIADVCDVPSAGAKVSGRMRRALEAVQSKTRALTDADKPRALLIVSRDPLHVAGPGTYLSAMLETCGATNAAQKADNPWKQYSVEMAVAADPDLLILASDHVYVSGTAAQQLRELRADEQWKDVKAVRDGEVTVIEGDLLFRAGPRLEEALRQMAAAVHPKLFAPTAPPAPS